MNAIKNEGENDIPKEPAPKCIGIVQLARIGDILQTALAAKSLKDQHPDIKIVLISREKFTRGLGFITEIVFDHVITIDSERLISEEKALSDKIEQIDEVIKSINSEGIDALINLTFSKTSAYLCSSIKAKHKLGLVVDEYNQTIIKDPWTQYVYSYLMTGSYNPFNLIDIFKSLIGVPFTSTDPIFKYDGKDSNKVIVHPFASQKKKQWKANKWKEILYSCLRNNPEFEFVIVGSKSEIYLSNDLESDPLIKKFSDRCRFIVGKTNIQELAEELSKARLFVGHDSMVGHLASIVGTPSITISLGTVRPAETIPYANGSIVLAPKTSCFPCFPNDKCDYFQCHTDISHQVASHIIDIRLQNKKLTRFELEKVCSPFHLNSTEIYQAESCPEDFLKLKSVLANNLSIHEVFTQFNRINWLYILLRKEELCQYPKLTNRTARDLAEYSKGFSHLFELSEFGKKYSRYILNEVASKTPNLNKIKEYSQRIDEIDHLGELLKKTYPEMSPLIDFFKIVKSNLAGENLVELTESSYLAFNDCGTICSIYHELISKTVNEYKIQINNASQGQR